MADPSMLVDELASILTRLESKPHDVMSLKRQLQLARQLQMSSEVLDTILKLSSLVMLDEDIWLSYFDGVLQAVSEPLTLEGFVDILERFDQAENDYLSLPILLRHVEFVLGCSRSSAGLASTGEKELQVDDEVKAFLTEEAVREMLRGVAHRGSGLLSESHLLWQPWIDWEKQLNQAEHVHAVFKDRVSIPHSTMDTTSSMYSAYCSDHCPNEYEARMVELTAASQTAKHKWSGEKRFGRTREDLEQLLITDPIQTFATYVDWETDPRAKNPRNERAPSTDTTLTRAVFERALAAYGRVTAAAEKALEGAEEAVRSSGDQTVHAYKTAEAELWERYAGWTKDDVIRSRAVRACPQIGSAWSGFMDQQERSDVDTEEAFQTALELGLLRHTSELANLYVSRAAFLHRRDRSDPQPVIDIIGKGFETIGHISKAGDPSLRLEKFLLQWAETTHPDILDTAMQLIDRPLKSRLSAYQMVLLRTGLESRRGNMTAARDYFNTSIQRTDLDWPETVFEAYLLFESIHGDLETISTASQYIEAEQQKLLKRRAKAVYEHQAQQVAPVVWEEVQTSIQASTSAEPVATTSAPAPVDDSHFKRDRENTTILVTGLSSATDKAQLESFFVEFGHIREITILEGDAHAALVEYRFADAVPGALTRDRKQLDGSTLHVSMLWRSTLFVTNFPPGMDDEGIRQLFSQYGTVLQTRWPSKKYSDSRRFCYITMASPAVAQDCLLLHGMQLEDLSLTVLISDPSAKTKRSDATDSGKRTLFVGGLLPATTEQDVEELLGPHGQVSHVKLGWDPVKRVSRGFAFVEMGSETDAQAACQALHGTRRNGKYLKVQLSDPNHASKKPDTTSNSGAQKAADKRQRTVRLTNLPEATQEGLLQQALEKIVPVKRLEIFARSHEALVELESQTDAGRLLLRPEPFVFNGATITILENARKPPPVTTSSLSFAPRTARPGKAIPKPRPQINSQTTAPPPAVNNQDFFRDVVRAKNIERGENKRKAEQGGESEAKRAKAD